MSLISGLSIRMAKVFSIGLVIYGIKRYQALVTIFRIPQPNLLLKKLPPWLQKISSHPVVVNSLWM
jgi:uncharacterized membrane protein YsdA (DUF1294 family)